MDNTQEWKNILAKMLDKYQPSQNSDFHLLRKNWKLIMKDNILEQFCVLKYFEDGKIGIKINSSVALSQFYMKKNEIMRNIKIIIPNIDIQDIIIVR